MDKRGLMMTCDLFRTSLATFLRVLAPVRSKPRACGPLDWDDFGSIYSPPQKSQVKKPRSNLPGRPCVPAAAGAAAAALVSFLFPSAGCC